MSADYLSLLFAAMCFTVLGMFGLCAFWRALELTNRMEDTKRFPRYGAKSDKQKPDD